MAKTRIVITVENGHVVETFSNNPDTEITVVDLGIYKSNGGDYSDYKDAVEDESKGMHQIEFEA